MWVRQIRALFDEFCDEDDVTFLTESQRRTYLERGYLEFRRLAANADPMLFAIYVDITVTDVDQYDLADNANAVRILGNPAGGLTGPRARRLWKLAGLDTSGQLLWWAQQSTVIEEVTPGYFPWNDGAGWAPFVWSAVGTKLLFDSKVTGTLRLWYDPYPTVDWTKDAVSDDEFVDDLDEFHDLIAALGYRLYLARTTIPQEGIERFISRRYNDMQDFISRSRMTDAAKYVREVY